MNGGGNNHPGEGNLDLEKNHVFLLYVDANFEYLYYLFNLQYKIEVRKLVKGKGDALQKEGIERMLSYKGENVM